MASRRPYPSATDPSSERARRYTINDVARLAQVSKKTVSRVINDSPFVAEDTRERVNGVIRELGYAPDPHARSLAFRRAFTLGFIYNNPNPQYVVTAQQGILDVAQAAGFELMVRPCDRDSPDFLSDMRAFVERQKLSGVVLFPSVSEDERLSALLVELETPYVRVASVALDELDAMLVTHDAEGARAAARHLTALGHRRIGLITGRADFRSAHERRRGFEEALAEADVALDPALVGAGLYTFESGVDAARALLERADRPTAVFALNDEMAAGVYRVAHDLKLSIPDNLSVVGFDDAPIATRLWPPLTSVVLPIREAARIAAGMLIAETRGAEPPARPRFTPTLVVRGSTARPG